MRFVAFSERGSDCARSKFGLLGDLASSFMGIMVGLGGRRMGRKGGIDPWVGKEGLGSFSGDGRGMAIQSWLSLFSVLMGAGGRRALCGALTGLTGAGAATGGVETFAACCGPWGSGGSGLRAIAGGAPLASLRLASMALFFICSVGLRGSVISFTCDRPKGTFAGGVEVVWSSRELDAEPETMIGGGCAWSAFECGVLSVREDVESAVDSEEMEDWPLACGCAGMGAEPGATRCLLATGGGMGGMEKMGECGDVVMLGDGLGERVEDEPAPAAVARKGDLDRPGCTPFALARAIPALPSLLDAAVLLLLPLLLLLPNIPTPPPSSTGCALPPLLRELRAPSLVLVGGKGIMAGWYVVDMEYEMQEAKA